jgi:hypothetical protein
VSDDGLPALADAVLRNDSAARVGLPYAAGTDVAAVGSSSRTKFPAEVKEDRTCRQGRRFAGLRRMPGVGRVAGHAVGIWNLSRPRTKPAIPTMRSAARTRDRKLEDQQVPPHWPPRHRHIEQARPQQQGEADGGGNRGYGALARGCAPMRSSSDSVEVTGSRSTKAFTFACQPSSSGPLRPVT